MELLIWCEECTTAARITDKYAVFKFESLTEAVDHIIHYGHVVKIDLESTSDSNDN